MLPLLIGLCQSLDNKEEMVLMGVCCSRESEMEMEMGLVVVVKDQLNC